MIHKTFTSFAVAVLFSLTAPVLGINHISGLAVSNSPGGTTSYGCRSQAQVSKNILLDATLEFWPKFEVESTGQRRQKPGIQNDTYHRIRLQCSRSRIFRCSCSWPSGYGWNICSICLWPCQVGFFGLCSVIIIVGNHSGQSNPD